MNITLGTIFGAFFVGIIKALIFVMQVVIIFASLGFAYSWFVKYNEKEEMKEPTKQKS